MPQQRAHNAWRRGLLWLLLFAALLAACAPAAQAPTPPTATPTGAPRPTVPTPTPTPRIPPNAPSDRVIAASVNWYLRQMSLDEQLGQLFLIETVWQGYNGDVDAMVSQLHAGAMIVYQQNMGSPTQLRSYLATIQAHARIPLLISMDEEGGVVDRLGYLGWQPPLPGAQALAASGDPARATQAGATAAASLKALGINTNLAPVADVRTTPYAIEYTRLYGDDPATVARYAGAFLDGVQANGVIGCLKHWPGIGSVTSDPHQTLPVLTASRAQLEATEFAPFKALLSHQPGMIMSTHVLVPALDPNLPASLSPRIVQGVLRDELGYTGVIMTDSLYMKGISLRYSLGEAGVLAILAGNDLLEGAYDAASMREMLAALRAAIASGRLSEARITESVRRILALKVRFGLLPPHELAGHTLP